MLLTSYLFLFLFLPVTLLLTYLINRTNSRIAVMVWLISISLVFYSFSTPLYLFLIIGSVLFNYFLGLKVAAASSVTKRKFIMLSGVALNIILLGYFKYVNFFIDNINVLLDTNIGLKEIILPLGISFFTLQQIAYLIDIYRGEERNCRFLEYFLFVVFFPKLIAGPIIRLKQMMPQIIRGTKITLSAQNVTIGLIILFLGIFKKVVISDHLSSFVDPFFNAASQGVGMNFINSWLGAVGYSFQLYFDFSGYCDMAIGLGLLFGIRLPLNFFSPYKANSIIDFWRRWHITLSHFIRDYIYIPLGGNRKGFIRQMVFLLIAMTIAGLWHGAGWTFVIWGMLHGLYLVINHGWRRLQKLSGQRSKILHLNTPISVFITFIAVTVAWVFFRSDSINTAILILKGMVGVYGFLPPLDVGSLTGAISIFTWIGDIISSIPGLSILSIIILIFSFIACWFLPNVQEYMRDFKPTVDSFQEQEKTGRFLLLHWKPSFFNITAMACITVLAILEIGKVSQFIYAQF